MTIRPERQFLCDVCAIGRRTAIGRSGVAFGALSGAADAYGYNARGEVVSARRALGGEDEISAVSGRVSVAKTPERFTYDADGNLTGDGRFMYTWNDENRMVLASNAEVVVTCAYDHRGRMIRKTVSRRDAEPQSIEYLWDGWSIIRETFLTPNSSFLIHNLWGLDLDGTMQGAGGVGGLLAVVRDGETYLPTYDANGNISECVSASDSTVAALYDYSPFGENLVASGPLASAFTHRFSTKPYCPVTGFCEYQMRKYRPDIGRWMSRDPIGEGGGINHLSNHNQWILMVDYLGLENCIQEVVSVSAHGSRYSINMKTGNYSTGDFDGRARKTGNGRWDAADTGKGLFDILENYSKNDNCGRCHCIKVLHIHSHANGIGVSMRWDSGFSIKNPEIITLMNWGYREETSVREGEARDIKDLKAAVAEERIRFCEDGIIIFYGCWTGSEEGLADRMSRAFPELTIVGPIDRASAVDEKGNIVSGPPQKEVGMGSKPGWNKWKKGKSTTIPGPISFYPSNPLNPLWKGGRL